MKTGVLCFLLAFVALAAWVCHQFVVWNVFLEHTDYLTLPPEFWSSAFFALFIGLALEGFFRVRRAG